MTVARVAIIGVGPRGLSILQHLGASATHLPAGCEVEVHLVDPGETGQGTHSSRQPAHLLTNTIANQVTMFSADQGPSFTEWTDRHGYRRYARSYFPTGGESGEAVGEHDYLPRSVLGAYLSWVFDTTARALPREIRLVHHRDVAVDVETGADRRLTVRLGRGGAITVDFAVLATGHCERTPSAEDLEYTAFVRRNAGRNAHLAYHPTPYPVDRLRDIAPGTDVLVQGLGLTAYDVISELTVGRDGWFDGQGLGTVYRPSGREPRLHLFSRGCLPSGARGVNEKGVVGQHRARFLTPSAIRRLRSATGVTQLDFETDVVPLLLREMGYAYRCAVERREVPPDGYEFPPDDRGAVEGLLDPLRDARFAGLDEFTQFFVDHATEDLRQAERGNLTAPLKAAADVVRDTRTAIREAIEFGGLTPDSHQAFTSTWVPTMNRVAFGPPRQRNAELLALLRAGVVDLAGGPGCRVEPAETAARFAVRTEFTGGRATCHADALVVARLDPFEPERDRSPLTANLLARGLVRPFTNGSYRPGGIDIDRSGRVIDGNGDATPNLWAVGYLVEGPRFYTHALPRQSLPSQFHADADACVRDMDDRIRTTRRMEGSAMIIESGGQLPYREFRMRHPTESAAPVHWSWKSLADALAAADHTEYGDLTLTKPDGDHQVVPGNSLTYQVVRPGERTNPHRHTWWHLYFNRSGSGSVVFDDIEDATEMNVGDVLLIPAWCVHHFENDAPREDLVLLNMSNLPQQSGLGNLFSEEKVQK